MNNLKLKYALLSVSFIFFSCKNDIKFDKAGWNQKDDLNSYPKREKMLNDLTKNYKLKGLKYSELVNLLGEPEIKTTSENMTATYNIVTEYENDIDPVYIEDLVIGLSHDSITQGCALKLWKK